MTDIHVIGFVDRFHRIRKPKINPRNIVKGYFKSISGFDGRAIPKTVGNFIKISYIEHNEVSNGGYFFIECLVEDTTWMPPQVIHDDQEFEVVFNGKRYEYKDLRRLYMDYVNCETANTIDSLP